MTLPKPLLVAAAVSFAAVMLLVPPIPQWQSYHDFADQRELLRGIPNTLDVISNVPFALIGVAGLTLLRRRGIFFTSSEERVDAYAFFGGSVLMAAGSTAYHLRPADGTLLYDRAGIVVVFMSFLALIVHARFPRLRLILPIMIATGLASVLWWWAMDDLRPYGWVQFFPLIAALGLVRSTKKYSGETAAIAFIVLAYLIAKIAEYYDGVIFEALGGAISGHTFKHLLAVAACLMILRWITTREPLPESATSPGPLRAGTEPAKNLFL